MIGTTLHHYTITRKLGEGGMGEVYGAQDTRLGREVALKVLPPELSDDQDRLGRFEREARAVAAMNHPNIVTIYSVEEVDGVHFITMEVVDGEPLEAMIPEKGFGLEEFFELAVPMADAVAAAHDKGIIHRDLKPANVMVTRSGYVKVLDFGLAKLQPLEEQEDDMEAPTQAMTQEGVVMGTVPYMSPEQIEGRRLDHRTDIFSLGIILYEMLIGSRPFLGESSAGLMSSILKDQPVPVTQARPELPRHLDRIIGRSLEKTLVERYQTARDVHYELKGLRSEVAAGTAELGGAPSVSVDPVESTPVTEAPAVGAGTSAVRAAPEVPWIAVLPLKNQGADPELESFADGLGDDITTGLSRFSFLHVVARHSALRVKDSGADMREIGAELGARYVLEGAVRKSGAAIRVNIQLLDAQTGTLIWAESFDRNIEESGIFDIQDAITDQVVATVADPYGMLAHDLVAPIATKAPEEMTPYEAVLRFFLYQQRITPEDHLVARKALERAVELDARYADAWAVLGVVLLDEYRHDFNAQPDPLDRALAAAQRAVDADPANQLANYSLAQIYFYRRDLGAFRASADRALGLNRRDGHTMAMIGILFGYSGDWDRGVELTTVAMRLNPHHPGWYRFTTFFDHYRKGELEEALAVAQKINMPEYFPTHYCLAIANNVLGNTEAAERARRDALRCWPEIEAGIENHLDMWWFNQPELKGRVLDELVGAGFRIPGR